MSKFMGRFVEDEAGATAIEYGLIASLIALGIIVAVTALGGRMNTIFTNLSTSI